MVRAFGNTPCVLISVWARTLLIAIVLNTQAQKHTGAHTERPTCKAESMREGSLMVFSLDIASCIEFTIIIRHLVKYLRRVERISLSNPMNSSSMQIPTRKTKAPLSIKLAK